MRRVFDNTISTALATVLLAACRLLLGRIGIANWDEATRSVCGCDDRVRDIHGARLSPFRLLQCNSSLPLSQGRQLQRRELQRALQLNRNRRLSTRPSHFRPYGTRACKAGRSP